MVKIRERRDGQVKYRSKSGEKYTVEEEGDEEEDPWVLEPPDDRELPKDGAGGRTGHQQVMLRSLLIQVFKTFEMYFGAFLY